MHRREAYASNADEERKKARLRRMADPDRLREYRRNLRAKNKDKINAAQNAARQADPVRFSAYQRKLMESNRDTLNASRRARLASDPVYAFTSRARCLIGGAIRRSGFKKAKKTEQLLGCTIEEFRLQIERQFLPGMGWHNMHLWHIDHIVPASSAKTLEEAEALNRAGNLRPYWALENHKKLAKMTHLL